MSETPFELVRVPTFKTAEDFRRRLAALGLPLPCDDNIETGPNSPLDRAIDTVTINGKKIGNRFAVQPMEGWDGTRTGGATDDVFRRWARFGESGAKLICGAEAMAVRPEGRANPNQLIIRQENKGDLAKLRETLVEAHRQHHGNTGDLVVGFQLTHSGRFCRPNDKRLESRVAFRHPVLDKKFQVTSDTQIFTAAEVKDLIKDYVAAAQIAWEAGADFVDIKHCHGYLLHEFLAAFTRADEFGGAFENRTRILREIVAGIRASGNKIDLAVRLSAFDTVPFQPDAARAKPGKLGPGQPEEHPLPYPYAFGVRQDSPLEYDLTEPVQFMQLCATLGIKVLNITAGSPYYCPHVQRPAAYPPSDGYQPAHDPLIDVMRQIDVVRQIKTQAPAGLVIVGSAYSYLQEFLPHVAQAVVRAGWVDMIGLGRMILSYPTLVSDVVQKGVLATKSICRTFSDCTTAPRNGMVSGCYPLDKYYAAKPEAKKLKEIKKALLILICLLGPLAGQGAALRVYDLKCDYQTEPLGMDDLQPCLSWKLDSAERGQRQTAWQIVAATTLAKLRKGQGDLWDSGKVNSSQSVGVPYGGAGLHSGERVYWKVRAWDRNGKPQDGQPAWWEMGLLDPADWRAVWITRPLTATNMFDDNPAPLLRKEFVVERKVIRARIRVSGLGYYELHLNGKRIGDHVLDPGWTTYSKRVLYSTYDVTAQLQRGRNAIGVMLGNGWFNPLPLRMWGSLNLREHLTIGEPRVCLQLELDFADGDSETIGTDESWKTGSGPILRNSVYLGEVYDARQEQPGWDRAGFDDSGWKQAVTAAEPLGPLRAQDAPPIRVTRILKPVKLSEPRPGVYIVDFGQNFAGWMRLHVQGPAGTVVKMRGGELLYPDGTLNGMTSVWGQIKQGGAAYRYEGTGAPKTAWQMDEYILKGAGREVYCPRFTFHGFRYMEITGLPQRPALGDFEGLRLNSDVPPAGSFSCSNEEFNRIQNMVLWTELSNLFSVESDCPHREKFGYGGDMVAASEAAILNFDMERFYAKAVQDLGDAVRTNGGFTETSPFVGLSDEGLGGGSGPVGWATAQPLLQWELYQYYGDLPLLATQYPATKRWISFLQACAQDDLLDNGISDHESLAPKPRALTGTAFYYFNVKLFAKIARALGHETDAVEADSLANRIKDAFNRKFLKPGNGCYDTGTQACQSFALYMGLVPEEEQARALAFLYTNIIDTKKGHLDTGIFGTKYMLNALTDFGRADVAYDMVNQRTFPGWGYMLENGATTLWEHWEKSDNTYSHNHPMFGSVSEWFYKGLGGINPAPDAVAFDKILIKPQPVADLTWVKSSYNSVRGKIVSEWKRDGGKFTLRVRVPVGASATVWMPAEGESSIKEGAKPLEQANGVHFMRMENGHGIIVIGSGDYEFTSTQ